MACTKGHGETSWYTVSQSLVTILVTQKQTWWSAQRGRVRQAGVQSASSWLQYWLPRADMMACTKGQSETSWCSQPVPGYNTGYPGRTWWSAQRGRVRQSWYTVSQFLVTILVTQGGHDGLHKGAEWDKAGIQSASPWLQLALLVSSLTSPSSETASCTLLTQVLNTTNHCSHGYWTQPITAHAGAEHNQSLLTLVLNTTNHCSMQTVHTGTEHNQSKLGTWKTPHSTVHPRYMMAWVRRQHMTQWQGTW